MEGEIWGEDDSNRKLGIENCQWPMFEQRTKDRKYDLGLDGIQGLIPFKPSTNFPAVKSITRYL